MSKVEFNKVELAKMLGLTGAQVSVDKWDISNLLEFDYLSIDGFFCGGKVIVRVEQEDLAKDKLDITKDDLVRVECIDVCCKQIEDLLWKRAADEYLSRVHNAAMLIGKGQRELTEGGEVSKKFKFGVMGVR